ncbi:type IX secretion system anionic LPS delivery protein PorZ [Aequorivita echinoideorum]|uniref:T9SS type A sorting domain-containing protein n=1 Tax=Aequorivita echinoideorum TaxID=1549647 RepID=A0ABS5S1B7_9FLAO|nr:two-component regulator propeller domain-containing protein [Aequorivita echinoideorum]MBT0607011.1 T9SS type A sorting domain-containing protein [Aequorivita echinoideorum]
MKRLLLTLLFSFPLLLTAQNFEDSWIGYFSYSSIQDISQGDNQIFVASENAIFVYDLATRATETISSVQGLSGEPISTIYYSEAFDRLIIGYESGLIEVVILNQNRILKVVDILEKQTIPPNRKRINHFHEFNGNIYIATQYGISVYDLEALEFGDTYFIGPLGSQINIYQTTVQEPFIYAVSAENGLQRAMVADDNLIDFENWPTAVFGNYRGVQLIGNEIYVLDAIGRVAIYDGDATLNPVGNFSNVVDFEANEDYLTITTTTSIQAYSEGFVLEDSANSVTGFDLQLQTGYAFNENLFLGTAEDGLLIVPFGSNQPTQVLPSGPLRNRPFSIDASPGQLWVNYGEITVTFNPYPLSFFGISNLKDSTWTNIQYEELSGTIGKEINDLIEVAINPENPDEVYMTSYQKGLLKIEGLNPTILYDETNSPLVIPGNDEALGIRLYGMDFDRQGNLWTVQSRTNEGLIRVNPQGQIQKIDISDIITGEDEIALSKVVISREGNVFFGAVESGLVGYNPSNNRFNIVGVDNGLPNPDIRALALDNQNRIWIGTRQGLRVLFSPGSFFEDSATPEVQSIIIDENGVGQELLFNQSITDIEVDGSNNKWISTATAGVFYLSPNGQETLLRFTRENSPLPSNNVQDIAIDPFTGVVYFATVNGLVAYKGTATAPNDNLENVHAFPNPVRPGFAGNVTIDGLTSQANVKITDIEGNLVFETTSEGGSVLWDTTAFGRYKVRSGVYLALITTEDGLETKVSKIMIIR